jgi:hypothetical protein
VAGEKAETQETQTQMKTRSISAHCALIIALVLFAALSAEYLTGCASKPAPMTRTEAATCDVPDAVPTAQARTDRHAPNAGAISQDACRDLVGAERIVAAQRLLYDQEPAFHRVIMRKGLRGGAMPIPRTPVPLIRIIRSYNRAALLAGGPALSPLTATLH